MSRSGRSLRALAASATLAVASAAATLAVAELVLHALGYAPALDHGWTLGTPARVVDRAAVLVNPDFLDDEHYRLRLPGAPTLVALGDSFTEGFGVPPEQSYPAVLARLLAERGTPTNVLNLGLGDSGPDRQLRLFLDHVLPRLEPDAVVWCFYANDLWDNVLIPAYDIEQGRLVPLDGTQSWIARRQALYDAIPLPNALKRSSAVLRLLLAIPGRMQLREIEAVGTRDRYAWSLEKIRLAVDEMQRLGRERGFDVHLFHVLPQADYLAREDVAWRDDWSVDMRRRLDGILGRAGATTIFFAGIPADEIFVDGTADPNALGGRHFNAEGYRRMAELIAERIAGDPTPSAGPPSGPPRRGPAPSAPDRR